MMLVELITILLLSSICNGDNDEPVITTPLGKVRGSLRSSHQGRKFSAFEGIPYAKPPIEERRFQEPEPIDPWDGTLEADFLIECAQTAFAQSKVVHGEEDCLYLNVYVPRDKPDPSEKLDVVVHVHGGGFMSGSGHLYAHPEYFMDKDIVFVTFNYRLGILGFLSTEDDVVPGNNGLKDQVLALKWIQNNIASFGGNPDSVTLTGLSSGGASVHFHYLSSMSKGLFHKGFSQSGVALNPLSLQDEPLQKAKILADAVGCPIKPSKALVKCLKQRPFRHILTKMPLFYGYKFAPFSPFGPVIEKGSTSFLDKNPYYLMVTGSIQDVPWLVSNTAYEGLFPAAYLYNDLEYINANWTTIAPFLLDYNCTLAKPLWESTAQTVKDYYFGKDQEINKDNFLKLVRVFSDRLFLVDAEAAVRLQAKANKSPVYYYRFSYSGDHSNHKTVAHGEDAQYFFHNIFKRETSTNELKMTGVMLDMLISFAKTGAPKVGDVVWEPVSFEKVKYLNVSGVEPSDIKMETLQEPAPRSFWKSLGFLENQNLMLMEDEL